MSHPLRKRLVLVGGGHAHLPALARARELVELGVEVTLITPHTHHYYSGMGPGMLSGTFRPEQLRFDVASLVESRGGRFRQGRVVEFDPLRRELHLEDGGTVPYDVASFNTGSRVPLETIPGAAEAGIPVKPIDNLLAARRQLLQLSAAGAPRVVVVGGGPAGVELSGNVERLFRVNRRTGVITLLEGGDRVLPGTPPRASQMARSSLARRGVRVFTGYRLASLEEGVARSSTGDRIPFDLALVTTGIVSQPLFRKAGVRTARDGAMLIDRHLRALEHPELFGAGDCVNLADRPLDRVGVYAIRQAPVLFHNLCAALTGGELREFEPQRRYLLIFNLGNGSGLAVWDRWVAAGRWAFLWKRYLDLSFVRRYQLRGEVLAD